MNTIFKHAMALLMASVIFSMPVLMVQVETFTGQGKVLISWAPTSSTTDYSVYRANGQDGEYQLIETIQSGDDLSYVDSNLNLNDTYYYKIETNGKFSEPVKVVIPSALVEDPKNPLMLINKSNFLSKNYIPTGMVSMGSYALRGVEAKRPVKVAYAKLYRAAEQEGYNIKVLSAYRSYELQTELFDYWTRVDGLEQALRTSAKPGTSEHQTGYALDVSSQSANWDLIEAFGETEEGKWLENNAYKYGFIIRYAKDTEAITGYAYEPWHIRYVGLEPAKEIYESKQTLEEYLGY